MAYSLIKWERTDLAIQSPWSQQGRVQGVWPVGGHDHLDSVQGVKAIHLV